MPLNHTEPHYYLELMVLFEILHTESPWKAKHFAHYY